MKKKTLLPKNLNPLTTIDFTAGLGYGLIFQPIIASNAAQQQPFIDSLFFVHRRLRRIYEM